MGDSMSTIINATTTNGVVIQPDNSGSLELQTNSGTTALTIDTSQRAAFVAGTAALPAITATGDTNTGMFFPAADTIAFAEGGAEAMRIASNGNVGIGTTSPSQKLDVNGSVVRNTITVGTSASPAEEVGFISAFSSTSYPTGMYFLNSFQTDYGNWLTFKTTNTAGTTAERMRIDSSGNVLVNTTSSSQSSKGLKINSDGATGNFIYFGITGTGSYNNIAFFRGTDGSLSEVGKISTTGSATSYVTSSDYRLKENIFPMTGALDKVLQLKPCTYTWKSDNSNGQGFIAHELADIVPDAVVGEKDEVDAEGNIKPQGVDTSFLVATLTAAIQEQQTIINDLKARVEILEAK
jgi:hypothetical protein